MKKVLLLFVRILLGAVFIYAGAGKIINPSAFADAIDNYRIAPYLLVTIMAIILPWVEVIVGLLLVLGRWLHGSSLIIILLNIVFIIAMSSAMFRGLDISCGCFSLGGDAARVGVIRLLEDVVYLLLAIVLLRSQTSDQVHQ
ncbi:DoxX family membrane protein [candidate division KSB1 bacterium]|nr:DoxX family membrane protein [candidate division KSB1 bacterium]